MRGGGARRAGVGGVALFYSFQRRIEGIGIYRINAIIFIIFAIFFIFTIILSDSKSQSKFVLNNEITMPNTCDALCQRYDQVTIERICESLEEACNFPCEDGIRYLDVVYIWKISREVCISIDILAFRASLRSLFRFGGRIVRRVFVVNAWGDKLPTWLNQEHPRIRVLGLEWFQSEFGRVPVSVEDVKFRLHTIDTISDPFLHVEPQYLFLRGLVWSALVDPKEAIRISLRGADDGDDAAEGRAIERCQEDRVAASAKELKERFQLSKAKQLEPIAWEQPLLVSHYVMRDIIYRHKLSETLPDLDFAHLYAWSALRMNRAKADLTPLDVSCRFYNFGRTSSSSSSSSSSSGSTLKQLSQKCKGVALLGKNKRAGLVMFGSASPVEKNGADLDVEREDDSDEKEQQQQQQQQQQRTPSPPLFECSSSSDAISLHDSASAHRMPDSLQPSFIPLRQRHAWRDEKKLSYEDLKKQVPKEALEHVDLVNWFEGPRSMGDTLVVTEFNAERGRYWCEVAAQVERTPNLRIADFWLLNEMDIGMARSGNVHTTRLLASALRMNYAWGLEWIELTRGTKKEQARTKGQQNEWGFHGNAILSRWPLNRASMVRLQDGMSEYFYGSPHEPGEKRLASRMALFAEARVGPHNVTLVATHMTTKWAGRKAHVQEAIDLIKGHLATHYSKNSIVLLGGDVWTFTCDRLGMQSLVPDRVGLNFVDEKDGKLKLGPKWRDDYICALGVERSSEEPNVYANGFRGRRDGKMIAISDHPIVSVSVRVGAQQLK